MKRPGAIIDYLQHTGWLAEGEAVQSVSRASEGNMNLVVRVRTDRRSVILK